MEKLVSLHLCGLRGLGVRFFYFMNSAKTGLQLRRNELKSQTRIETNFDTPTKLWLNHRLGGFERHEQIYAIE